MATEADRRMALEGDMIIVGWLGAGVTMLTHAVGGAVGVWAFGEGITYVLPFAFLLLMVVGGVMVR